MINPSFQRTNDKQLNEHQGEARTQVSLENQDLFNSADNKEDKNRPDLLQQIAELVRRKKGLA
jgi:hypothetical protein